MDLTTFIKVVPGFPYPGVNFKDISPLLAAPLAFSEAIQLMTVPLVPLDINGIVAIDARGFIFGAAIAQQMHVGLYLVRKKGKIPGASYCCKYETEYSVEEMEIGMNNGIKVGRLAIVDDVIAKGGTILGAAALASHIGEVVGVSVLINLSFLGGAKKVIDKGIPVYQVLLD